MSENMVRLSFDIPVDEHISLKTACALARMTMKEYLQHLVHEGIKDLEKKQLKEKLKKSIDQAKEGKRRIISSAELDEMFENAD